MGGILGIVNDNFHTDFFSKTGSPLPQGTLQLRTFVERDYAAYVGDTYRVNRALTLNFGVRYENFRPPFESHGIQVTSTYPLTSYFAQRDYLQTQGVPQNAMPNAILQWGLNGPANGKPTWWSPYNKAFAPRLGMAYAPADHSGLIGKIFAKSGVFRAGAGMAYDRFGSDLITQYDQYRSNRLATQTNFPGPFSLPPRPPVS